MLQFDENERERRQSLLSINDKDPPVDRVGDVSIQIIPRVFGGDILWLRVEVWMGIIIHVKNVENVIQQTSDRLIVPFVVPLIKVDIVGGVGKELVDV